MLRAHVVLRGHVVPRGGGARPGPGGLALGRGVPWPSRAGAALRGAVAGCNRGPMLLDAVVLLGAVACPGHGAVVLRGAVVGCNRSQVLLGAVALRRATVLRSGAGRRLGGLVLDLAMAGLRRGSALRRGRVILSRRGRVVLSRRGRVTNRGASPAAATVRALGEPARVGARGWGPEGVGLAASRMRGRGRPGRHGECRARAGHEDGHADGRDHSGSSADDG